MDRTADLGVALGFVIGRIEEQAMRSGEPLTVEQRLLLNDLPKTSSLPGMFTGDPESLPMLVPRDATYERLCALAKAARRNDLALNPASLDWEFSFAVLQLNRHPMCWLLQWAGVKQRRPWWDRWLLIVAGLLVVVSAMALVLLAGNQPWTVYKWAGVGAGYVAIMLVMYFVSRRIEERQLEQNVERCRRGARFAGA